MINIRLKNAAQVISDVRTRRLWLYQKTVELVKRLKDLGAKTAQAELNTAIMWYDGIGDGEITVDEISPKSFVIRASGQDVCFLEFGAGVYYNSSEPYPIPRPQGIAGIGEYGKGHGKQQAWYYTDENGESMRTKGNPAMMFMYNTGAEMKRNIERIAREVFKGE